MSEQEIIDKLSCPTENHKKYMQFISKWCTDNKIPGFLKGSLSKGTARPYSDIDLVLLGINSPKDIDSIMGCFDDVLLSEKQITSTFMVIYRCGLAVEYDIRKTITMQDIEKAIPFGSGDYRVSTITKDRVKEDSSICPYRDVEYSVIVLAQMCGAKVLCDKQEQAREIYCDRMEKLVDKSNLPTDFREIIKTESLKKFTERLKNHVFGYKYMSDDIRSYFINMFNAIKLFYE